MFTLNVNNFIKFHLDLFKNFTILSNEDINNIGDKILQFEKEYDEKYSKILINIKKEKKIKNLIIYLLKFIINIKDDEKLDYLKIKEIKKIFCLSFDLNDNQINYIFSIVNNEKELIANFDKLQMTDITDITDIKDYTNMEYINKLCKMFAINLLFFKNYVKLFNVKKIIENLKTKLKNILSKSPNYNSSDYDISYDAESSFLLSSRRKIKSLGNEEKSLKSSFKKSFSKQKLLEKILMEKLYRLIYYYNRIKINEDNIYVIYQTFIQTIKELDNYNNEIFKIKNLQDIDIFIDFDLDYNKKNNINYYNYGSETTLLLLLKQDIMDLEKIRKYVEKCKKIITETEGIKQKYNINNYFKKIGYDLALALYIFTDYSKLPTYEELKNIIYKILDDIYNNIDNYIDEINKYYNDIMNLKLNSISNTKQTYMKQHILNIFKNSLYKDEPEQLKYNLYRYKYQEFNDKGEPIILWFINDVILRFSDI